MFLAFMIVFIALAIGSFGFAVFKTVKLLKHPMPKTINYPNELIRLLYIVIGVSVSTLLALIFMSMFLGYRLNAGEWVELVFGGLLLGACLPAFALSFVIHYYGKEIPVREKKILFYEMIGSGVFVLIALLLVTNSIADHIDKVPLCNGINFTYGFVNPLMTDKFGNVIKPNLAWYAICILSGAVLVYFICDHRLYKEYGKHGIIESTFFVAFPAGIIGARVGFVIGEWHKYAERVASGEWWSIFAVWEGGLTIISGALVGIIVGVLWFMWRNKKYSIWVAVDIIVPTILIAQAIGRLGNFFNCEVHGTEVNASNWWFLPKIIANNAVYSESGQRDLSGTGNIFAPLFYVEFLSNFIGYFIIRFAVGKGLKKYIELGDLAFSYIVWYGLTRVIMEPMRDTPYNMGNDGYWSWVWSIMFVIIGCFLIFTNHLVRAIIRKVKKQPILRNRNIPLSIGVTSAILLASLALIIVGSLFMSSSTQSATLAFNTYNNGLITLSVGLGVFLIFLISLIYLLEHLIKKNQKNETEKV